MQRRHYDRRQYFCELAGTAREYYLDYLRPYIPFTTETRVLEIGCGEGGNLLPFAEMGCQVTGIDISRERICQAKAFFAEANRSGTFLCQNFILVQEPQNDDERYDLVLVHDVIEHIEPCHKRAFFHHIKAFLKPHGIVFFGFPAWQNPFGGHQQITTGFASKLPFIHLLPRPLYKALLKLSRATPQTVAELMSIRRSQMSVERFERLANAEGYTVVRRTLWLINPHYKQKFRLHPLRLPRWLSTIPHVRNFFTTSCFYVLTSFTTDSEFT